MKKQIFPKEFISSSIESYTFEIGKKSRAVYATVLFSLLMIVGSLPFIKVQVSKSVPGQITPLENRVQINSPLSGRVTFSIFKENRSVNKGDTLLIFEKQTLLNEIKHKYEEKERLVHYINDLFKLIEHDSNTDFNSDRYKLTYDEYQASVRKLDVIYANSRKNFDRQRKLFEADVISEQQFEEYELSYEQSVAERDYFRESNRAKWKVELLNYQEELDHLHNQLSQYQDQVKLRYIVAPASGTLQNVMTPEEGQFIHVGAKIADLSPGDGLVATCLVSPVDIGLLRIGQKSTFRIDAFNYNEWGMINGAIYEISEDVYFQNNQPYFQVKCAMDQNYLTLHNGFVGRLRKGMTVQANFNLAERTLYQLLHDNVDSWVNPKSINTEIAINHQSL